VLWRLTRLEIVNLLRDSRLTSGMAVFAAVMLLSSAAALVEVQQSARSKRTIAAQERERWLGQGEIDPHAAAHYSIYAFKPSLPLQAVDPGIVPFVGEAVWLEAHLQNDLLFRPQQDARPFERFGLVDPAGLLTRFGPLAIFLLAFAAAARERERGVVGLALGTAVIPRVYVAAKAIAVMTIASTVIVLPVVLAGAASTAASGAYDGDTLLRLGAWTLGALAYVAALSLIGVAICLVARSAPIAFGALLFVWVAFVLAALPAASAAAERQQPLPSFQRVKLVVAEEAPAYWLPEPGERMMATLLARYGAVRESEVPDINTRGLLLDGMERHAHEVFDREIGGFYDRVAAQDAAYAAFGWLSPAVAFDAASASFAGTDFVHHRDFLDFAEQYRRTLVNRMNADLIPHPAVDGREHTNDIELWSQIPQFAYAPLPLSTALRTSMAAWLALAGWVVAAVGLGLATAATVRP
jgi:ABC-2 type transport system permease protein